MASELFSRIEADPKAIVIRPAVRRSLYRVTSHLSTVPMRLRSSTGAAWPCKVGASIPASADCRILVIGPTEALAICSEPLLPLRADNLHVTVDMTDGFAPIEIVGREVTDLLASVCSLDFDASVFRPDSCARTHLAGVAVILDRLSADHFTCYVARSYSSYVMACLAKAAHCQ